MQECPYCKAKMKQGYIPTDTIPPQWIPEGKKINSIRFFSSKDGIEMSGEKCAAGNKATAYFCENCGIAILNAKLRM